MSLTMYSVTVPVFARYLDNLQAMLVKAEAHAAERKIKPEVLPNSRLAPDMLPLAFQVQSVTDRIKLTLARLTGRTAPPWEDNEVTLEDLRLRVQKGLDYVATFAEADLAGTEEKTLTVRMRGEDTAVPALQYSQVRRQPLHEVETEQRRKG